MRQPSIEALLAGLWPAIPSVGAQVFAGGLGGGAALRRIASVHPMNW
jgi:hypothetical protein